MRRPSFQFYPSDWRKDVELRSCSLAARGLWIDLMCIAHECTPYGHLVVNGKAMTPAQIAGQAGITVAQCKALIEELIENGVARVNEEGVIFSKRMVEDECLRNRRAEGGKAGSDHGAKGAEHGKKGGRPRKETGDSKTPLKTPLDGFSEPPPSSSSSSSTSVNTSLRSERERDATPAGLACRAMREAGLADANPSHPLLTALLESGVTVPELASAAEDAVRREKGFAYALKTAEGRRTDAAKSAAILPSASAVGVTLLPNGKRYHPDIGVFA